MELEKFFSKRINIYIIVLLASLALFIYLRVPHRKVGVQLDQPVVPVVSQLNEAASDDNLVTKKIHSNKPFEPINGVDNIGRGDPFSPVK